MLITGNMHGALYALYLVLLLSRTSVRPFTSTFHAFVYCHLIYDHEEDSISLLYRWGMANIVTNLLISLSFSQDALLVHLDACMHVPIMVGLF